MTIKVRDPEELYIAQGRIQDGTFKGRWHFSFDQYRDPENIHFGTLRVFNDDTLSEGAIWPLHPHRRNEVVTYVMAGEFRHEDEHGKADNIMTKGHVQHTTIGTGMYHSEINNRKDKKMRFIQLWFFPEQEGLIPSVEQLAVEKPARTNLIKPLVSKEHKEALPIRSDARVFASFLENEKQVSFMLQKGWGVYLVALEGGNLKVNGETIRTFGAAKIWDEEELQIVAEGDTELLLIEVKLDAKYIPKYS